MDDPPAHDPIPHVPPREMEVLQLMCDPACWLEKEMPEMLGMSMGTFKEHKERLFRKFKVNSRHGLLVAAIRLQMVRCYCQLRHPHREAGAMPSAPPPAP